MRIDNPQIQLSGSQDTGLRQNITYASATEGGVIFVADGKIYACKSNNGGNDFYAGANWPNAFTNDARNGLNNMIEIAIPGESGSLTKCEAAGNGAYALFDNGNLYTWGENGQGWCGTGNTTQQYYPTQSAQSVTDVYTHPSNNCGENFYSRLVIKKTDGKIYAAGYNANYELGLGDTTNRTSFTELTWAGVNPISVWNVGSWGGAIVVQKSDGTLVMSGRNAEGLLGLGNTNTITTATSLSSNAWLNSDTTYRIEEILFGGRYFNGSWINVSSMTMLLRNASGTRIVSTGWNSFGFIGDGTTTNRNVPTVPTGTWNTVAQIARRGGGEGDTFVLKTDGTVWAWGRNQQGSMGTGNNTQQNTPIQLQTGVTRMFSGMTSTWYYAYQMNSPLLEKTDGYYIAGLNDNGQSGTGLVTSPIYAWTRVDLPASTRIKMLGETCTSNAVVSKFAVTTDNQIWAWGYNGHGVIEPTGANVWQPIRFTPSIMQR